MQKVRYKDIREPAKFFEIVLVFTALGYILTESWGKEYMVQTYSICILFLIIKACIRINFRFYSARVLASLLASSFMVNIVT